MGPAVHAVHTLHPGDVVVARRGERLETLLGSCVAIVLTDPRRTVGAMCHIVHPGPPRAGSPASAAFADVALQEMTRQLLAQGIAVRWCEGWVFGGGNMFPQLAAAHDVGQHNARWAVAALQHLGVRVLLADLGGSVYRRLAWTVGPEPPQVSTVAL